MTSKVKVGVSLDRELLGKIDAIIEASKILGS
jgi:metal-responsive CopG/Arc/MetJ family transcriptional regulator